ncbi:MAG: hypothetical protein LUE21_05690 [Oscillospiraceae bacterium]|nr:hypothetical protein [Oscillospiraceae bacterium]
MPGGEGGKKEKFSIIQRMCGKAVEKSVIQKNSIDKAITAIYNSRANHAANLGWIGEIWQATQFIYILH